MMNVHEHKKKLLAILLLCALCLSGCGRVTDLFHKAEELPAKSTIEQSAKDEIKEQSAAVLKENVSATSGGAQEFSKIEEKQVEEGKDGHSKSELEEKRESVGLSEADIAGLQESQSGNYYFEQLYGNEKILYVECYQILAKQAEDIPLSTTDAKMLTKVYQCVINDHPELFYINGYSYTQYTKQDTVQYITFSGRYLYDAQEVKRRQNAIYAAVAEKTSKLVGKSEYEIVKMVYEDLILSTDYSMESADNQNICSVFLDKKSVCNGYAKAAQYLLNDLGIFCIIVNGKAGGDSHAWNIVEIDGAYYQMDVTWGDPSYYTDSSEEQAGAPNIDYSYLCVTSAELSLNHSIDTQFAVPKCDAVKDNYFVREGLYLAGYEERKIREIFDAAKAQGKNVVIIKASDGQAYQEIYDKLIGQQKIFDYFGTYQPSGEYKIAYSGNEELHTISFWE